MLKKYFHLWLMFTVLSVQGALQSKLGTFIFATGKILRFWLFLWFLLIIESKIQLIQGYTSTQLIFFFLTFNLVDSGTQFLFREVYNFRRYISSGDFDYFLIKPISPIFRALLGGSDPLDIPMLVIAIGAIIYYASIIGFPSAQGIFLYIVLVINAFIISLAFHIFALCVGVLSSEVDSALWLYRDISLMARIPIDIYKEPLRGILTFVIPIGIMVTFPAKALFGLLSLQGVIIALIIGVGLLWVSFKTWQYAIKSYTSASS